MIFRILYTTFGEKVNCGLFFKGMDLNKNTKEQDNRLFHKIQEQEGSQLLNYKNSQVILYLSVSIAFILTILAAVFYTHKVALCVLLTLAAALLVGFFFIFYKPQENKVIKLQEKTEAMSQNKFINNEEQNLNSAIVYAIKSPSSAEFDTSLDLLIKLNQILVNFGIKIDFPSELSASYSLKDMELIEANYPLILANFNDLFTLISCILDKFGCISVDAFIKKINDICEKLPINSKLLTMEKINYVLEEQHKVYSHSACISGVTPKSIKEAIDTICTHAERYENARVKECIITKFGTQEQMFHALKQFFGILDPSRFSDINQLEQYVNKRLADNQIATKNQEELAKLLSINSDDAALRIQQITFELSNFFPNTGLEYFILKRREAKLQVQGILENFKKIDLDIVINQVQKLSIHKPTQDTILSSLKQRSLKEEKFKSLQQALQVTNQASLFKVLEQMAELVKKNQELLSEHKNLINTDWLSNLMTCLTKNKIQVGQNVELFIQESIIGSRQTEKLIKMIQKHFPKASADLALKQFQEIVQCALNLPPNLKTLLVSEEQYKQNKAVFKSLSTLPEIQYIIKNKIPAKIGNYQQVLVAFKDLNQRGIKLDEAIDMIDYLLQLLGFTKHPAKHLSLTIKEVGKLQNNLDIINQIILLNMNVLKNVDYLLKLVSERNFGAKVHQLKCQQANHYAFLKICNTFQVSQEQLVQFTKTLATLLNYVQYKDEEIFPFLTQLFDPTVFNQEAAWIAPLIGQTPPKTMDEIQNFFVANQKDLKNKLQILIKAFKQIGVPFSDLNQIKQLKTFKNNLCASLLDLSVLDENFQLLAEKFKIDNGIDVQQFLEEKQRNQTKNHEVLQSALDVIQSFTADLPETLASVPQALEDKLENLDQIIALFTQLSQLYPDLKLLKQIYEKFLDILAKDNIKPYQVMKLVQILNWCSLNGISSQNVQKTATNARKTITELLTMIENKILRHQTISELREMSEVVGKLNGGLFGYFQKIENAYSNYISALNFYLDPYRRHPKINQILKEITAGNFTNLKNIELLKRLMYEAQIKKITEMLTKLDIRKPLEADEIFRELINTILEVI